MSTDTQPYADPFAGAEKRPAVSFRDKPIGYSVTGVIVAPPNMAQCRNFDTGDPDFWPDGNKKMAAVVEIELPNGNVEALWCPKPSAMFAACAAAQTEAGSMMAVGGTLTITFTGEQANPAKPKLNPQKQYAVKYTPPNAFAGSTAPGEDEPPF